MPGPLTHRRARMDGRDPFESHRAATPLELLFDLTFVVAFGIAADELAHYVAEDHVKTGLLGFALGTFAITWAWINFSWFASAYDTDDWVFRLLTMVQMVGVIILALGLADVFESIDEGHTVDNGVMVAGYVVMRVAMVFQWGRAARQDPARRAACVTYIKAILVAQAGWIALLLAQTSVALTFACAAVLTLVEFAGPWIAETRKGGTPWHAHHIVERYGLLVIIALGEGLLGTIASLSVARRAGGAGLDGRRRARRGVRDRPDVRHVVDLLRRPVRRDPARAPRAVVRLGLRPHPDHRRRRGHGRRAPRRRLLPRGPLGAGRVRHRAQRGDPRRRVHPRDLRALHVPDAVVRRLPRRAAAASRRCCAPRPWCSPPPDVSLAWCLAVLCLSPWVTVVGYELRGYEHNAEASSTRLADDMEPEQAG